MKPSKAKDRIGDADTARQIADNNIAIEQGCEPAAAEAVRAAR